MERQWFKRIRKTRDIDENVRGIVIQIKRIENNIDNKDVKSENKQERIETEEDVIDNKYIDFDCTLGQFRDFHGKILKESKIKEIHYQP